MNVVIHTLGTRGDVQPFVALGVRLLERGHRVRICTCERFESFVRDRGLDFADLDDGILRFIESDRVREMIGARKSNLFQWVRAAVELLPQVKEMQRRMLDDQWRGSDGAELLLFHPKALGGPHIAEKLGVPVVSTPPFPAYVPTAEFPMFVLGARSWGRTLNRLSYAATRRGQASIAGTINAFRTETLGLSPRRRFSIEPRTQGGRPIPVMHPISPRVLRRPADWPDHAALTGYWFLPADDDWTPDPELERFLAAGDAPVYIGFGSMVTDRPERMAAVVLEAVERAGVRAILGLGWGGLRPDAVPASVLPVGDVPHDRLFPRCAAVVHHGGAGSVAAGLRAGLPTLVVPHIADQPLWGKRVHELGVGPPPLTKKKLDAETLADGIARLVDDRSMRDAAGRLGERIREEDGPAEAVAFMGRHGIAL